LGETEGFDPATQGVRYDADSIALGDATVELTGLDPEKTYCYIAFAINSEGIAYGSEQMFTTNASADTDGDGAIDKPEEDPDGDGIPSGIEAQMGSDPDDPGSTPADKDGDGVLDNPKADTDGDGIIDEEEVAYGSDPNDPNSVPEFKTDWSFAGIGKYVWPAAGIAIILLILLLLRNVKISYTVVDGLGNSKRKTIRKLVLGAKDNIVITLGRDISIIGADGMRNSARSFSEMEHGAEADLTQAGGFAGIGEIKLSKGLTKRLRNKSITIKYKDSEPVTYHVRKSDGQNFIQNFEIK
jgi:heme exporter protein D